MIISNAIVSLRQADLYQQEKRVLEQVDLDIRKGEFCYLIGKSGSGKTTLLKTIYGALPLEIGTGSVCGFDLRQLNRNNIPMLRRKLGIVFQDFNLLTDRNVFDNLYFTLQATGWTDKEKMKFRIQEVLSLVGLADASKAMPNNLSGGEQQRIVIARALLNQPELMIADEPTGNLDPDTSDELVQLLRQLSQLYQTAIIFATHDYRIMERFPARILRCQNAKVFEEEAMSI